MTNMAGLRIDGPVSEILLNDPDRRNALSAPVTHMRLLTEARFVSSARTSVSLPFPDLRNVTAPWKDISLTQPLQCQWGRNVRATPLVPEILSFRYLIRDSGATPGHR